MSMGLITLIVVVAFFALMILGLPIAFCLITTSVLAAVVFWDPAALYVVPTTIYSQGTKEVLLAIPLFVFLAAVLERSGIAESLYDLFYKWLGRLGGGLAIACVVICTIIDAISGLGASGIVTIGPIGLKEMFKRNYHKHMALGCITAGSALGPLIPPSVVMIIIAGFTGLSVGKLFCRRADSRALVFRRVHRLHRRCVLHQNPAWHRPSRRRSRSPGRIGLSHCAALFFPSASSPRLWEASTWVLRLRRKGPAWVRSEPWSAPP